MESLKFEVIVFDLRKYNTVEDIENIAVNNGLTIDCKKLSDLSSKYSKVFIDKIENEIFAVIYKGSTEVTMSKDCENRLLKIKSKSPVSESQEFSVDNILDKINEKGVNSLSAREKYFLKKNS
jgi:hypothetical protein